MPCKAKSLYLIVKEADTAFWLFRAETGDYLLLLSRAMTEHNNCSHSSKQLRVFAFLIPCNGKKEVTVNFSKKITAVQNNHKIYLKVIYRPIYGLNNYVLIWGDWLSCDPSQSPHIWG